LSTIGAENLFERREGTDSLSVLYAFIDTADTEYWWILVFSIAFMEGKRRGKRGHR
jgi:hypothetical protein